MLPIPYDRRFLIYNRYDELNGSKARVYASGEIIITITNATQCTMYLTVDLTEIITNNGILYILFTSQMDV